MVNFDVLSRSALWIEPLLTVVSGVLICALVVMRLSVPQEYHWLLGGTLGWCCALVLVCIMCVKGARFSEMVFGQRLANELKDYTTDNTEENGEAGNMLIDTADQMLNVVRLAASREHAIADYSRDIICSFSSDFAVAAINSASERILGYAPIEMLGKSLSSIIVEADNTRLQKVLEEARTKKETITFALRLMARQGKVIDTSWQAEWSETDKMFFAIARDVTQQTAEERTRQEMIAMISHDVRSPLSSVLLGITAFSRGTYGEITDRAKQSLNRMENSIDRIIDLLTELLDLEKSVAGELKLDKSDFNVRNLATDAVDQMADLATKLDVSLENNAEDLYVYADRKRIFRVLFNLLSNAIKHSPSGTKVTVQTRKKLREVEISIVDCGPGIPEHLQKAIFERFVQLETPSRSEVPSTGLGLAICKSFVEAHNCLIGVTSEPGKGSTFWFLLPLSSEVQNSD
jgi:two-component system, OmpR family, sensor histidine kinase VicK